jgi:hypothetical protein
MVISKIKKFVYEFVNGIRSGIPLCCVIHFCKEPDGPKGMTILEKCGWKWYDWSNFAGCRIQYIPCPKCLNKKRFVTIKNNGLICNFLIPEFGKNRFGKIRVCKS